MSEREARDTAYWWKRFNENDLGGHVNLTYGTLKEFEDAVRREAAPDPQPELGPHDRALICQNCGSTVVFRNAERPAPADGTLRERCGELAERIAHFWLEENNATDKKVVTRWLWQFITAELTAELAAKDADIESARAICGQQSAEIERLRADYKTLLDVRNDFAREIERLRQTEKDLRATMRGGGVAYDAIFQRLQQARTLVCALDETLGFPVEVKEVRREGR
jgi:hypothetical protein